MKAIIITGTSNGLGQAIFDNLWDKKLLIISFSRKFLEYQERIARENPTTVRLITQDLSDISSLLLKLDLLNKLLLNEVEEIIFINNAGVIDPIGKIGCLSSELVINSININLTAPLLITNALFAMQKTSSLKIKVLNISSGAANYPIDGWALYCTTKAGYKMFLEVLQEQILGDQNSIFYNIDPGVMDTKMQEKIRLSNKLEFPKLDDFINLKSDGKLQQPNEVAQRIIKEYIGL
jgi:benzil reductase ((S)-benzoin forming)